MSRQKICKACGNHFTPVRFAQVVCNDIQCALTYAKVKGDKLRAAKAREEAKAHRERKVRAKTKADWARDAQAAFNRFIRLRDHDKPCISCGRHHTGQWHAGHYRTTKAAPELRFDEDNVHKQCAPCNNHLSGNIVSYRIGLIERIGPDRVARLEGPHEPKRYTIDNLREIRTQYTKMVRELESKT